ncbi:hypothetical protein [Pusillimonas noertemannii]|nr:hypothetical protein [Pusillimonas noertemannii]
MVDTDQAHANSTGVKIQYTGIRSGATSQISAVSGISAKTDQLFA